MRCLPGTTWADVAAGLSRRLGKEAVAARVDDQLVDLLAPVRAEARGEFPTFCFDEEGQTCFTDTLLPIYWHRRLNAFFSLKRNWLSALLVADGFYYDFDVDHLFSPRGSGCH